MSESPEQIAMREATKAVLKILTVAKNPRTLLGQMRPTAVAYHVAWEAITVHREALAHEQARRSHGICQQCGHTP